MAELSDLQGFLLTGVNSDWSTLAGTVVDPAAQFGYFDVIDANDDGALNPTGVSGDRVRIDGATANPDLQPVAMTVTAVLWAEVTITYTDGSSYTPNVVTGPNATAFRIYQLSDGRAVLRPVDTTLQDPNLQDYSQWQSLTINRVGDVGGTTMARQDDPFYLPCFTTGTLILTATGETPVEVLRPGDLLQTADHGLRPIRWIGRVTVSAQRIRAAPNLSPILISASAIAPGLPARPLRLSPQHRVLLRSSVALRMFDSPEVLCPIKCALPRDGIATPAQAGEVTYLHLLLDAHEVIFAEGLPCESLYLGPQITAAMPDETRAEISALFPLLAGQLHRHSAPARPLIRGRRAERLIARIADRPLIEPQTPALARPGSAAR